jgi:hypothetical protein
MFVYKKLKASDASRTPFEAHKQYVITADNTSSLGIDFFSARFSSSSKDAFSLNDPNETKKYFQLDKIYYNKDFGNTLGGLEYEDQDTRLYKELNVISIPQGLFGSSIQKGSLNLFETYTDDSKGNVYNSSLTLSNYPTDKERVLYIAPVKGFKLSDLNRDYNTGYSLVNAPTTLDKVVYDDSLYLNSIEYISSSITHLPDLNCTGINLESGYVKSPHSNNINFGSGQDFTISFYYKTPTLSGTKYLIAKSYSKTAINSPERGNTRTTGSLQATEIDAGPSYPFEIYLTDNQINFARADQDIISLATSSAVLDNNTLYHIACVKTGSNLRIYVNGNLTGSDSDSTNITKNKANLYIGNRGGTRSEYTSAGGTLSQLMIFNKGLNNTQISNVSSSITGLPYIGNIFYENGLITITSPKYTNNLGNINESVNSQITISPTYGSENDFDIKLLESEGATVFKSTFTAFNSQSIETNIYSATNYDIIDFSNTGVGGKLVSSSNQEGDSTVGEYSLFTAQAPFERDEYFTATAFSSKLLFIGGAYGVPTLYNLYPGYVIPSGSTGGFNPTPVSSSTISITSNSSKWLISASELTTTQNFTIKASASQFVIDESFPTSDSSISDTVFSYDQNTADSGALYINDYVIDGLVLTGSLEDIPNYAGFIRNLSGLAGTEANGDTRIRIPATSDSATDDRSNIQFREGGLLVAGDKNDIKIITVPSDNDISITLTMSPKFTNSEPFARNVTYKIRSGSTAIASKTVSIPGETSVPLATTPLTVTRFITASDEYDMTIDMGGRFSLEMTEATLQITSQTPGQGKRNKVALINNSLILDDRDNDRTKCYTVQIDEIHTSASNQATGPNFDSITEGSLKVTLERVFQGQATTITSSIYGPETVSGSFFKFINLDDIDGNGTINTHVSYLRTKIELIDTSSLNVNLENPLQTFSNGEGFYIKNFKVKEISGSSSATVSVNVSSFDDFTTDEEIPNRNTAGPFPYSSVGPFNIDPGAAPNNIIVGTSAFPHPILTIDATGSLVEIGATASLANDPTLISASFSATASEAGVYVISGFIIDSNFTSGFPRLRIYSGSTLITSSFGSTVDLRDSSHSDRLSTTSRRINLTSDLPGENSVELGYLPEGGQFKVELDVVESNGTTLKPTPSNESASYSGLGVFYLTSSNQLRDNISATPNFLNTFNSIQIHNPDGVFPYTTTTSITESLLGASGFSVDGEYITGQLTDNTELFFTSSLPITQSNLYEAVPFMVERIYNLDANSRYIISQSLNFNSTNGNKIIWRIARTEDEATPNNLTEAVDLDFISSANNIFSTENQWVTASATIDTTTGGEYTAQFLIYNVAAAPTTNATQGDFLKLASASLLQYSGSNTITRVGGNNFSNTNLQSIKLNNSGTDTLPIKVGDSNPQTYDDFTFVDANNITLSTPIFLIDNGEITGSEGNVFAYYKYTSSLNIASGFDLDMDGGVISNLGDYPNTFNILNASNNTMSINDEVLLLSDTTANVEYVTGGSISDFNLQFKNSHLIFEHEYQCTVSEDEYNFSLNPTLRLNKDIEEGELANFATGSNFKPYVTTVGLYNEEGELLVVGKLGQPMKMSNETDTTFIVRFDT